MHVREEQHRDWDAKEGSGQVKEKAKALDTAAVVAVVSLALVADEKFDAVVE